MEAVVRKPFQGVTNIIRFNWHFYAIAASFVVLLSVFNNLLYPGATLFVFTIVLIIGITTLISLLVSFYVYDLSSLYKLNWLDHLNIAPSSNIVNINAGFDETSHLLQNKYPEASLRVVDFYDPLKHTEVSIKRARRMYSIFQGTEQINTTEPFLKERSADHILLILAAHEIRNRKERGDFFIHLQQAIKEDGSIIVVEHLRDLPNFLAYSIGFFHFFSKKNWKDVFKSAGLVIADQQNITPFIVAFSLKKNGTAS